MSSPFSIIRRAVMSSQSAAAVPLRMPRPPPDTRHVLTAAHTAPCCHCWLWLTPVHSWGPLVWSTVYYIQCYKCHSIKLCISSNNQNL